MKKVEKILAFIGILFMTGLSINAQEKSIKAVSAFKSMPSEICVKIEGAKQGLEGLLDIRGLEISGRDGLYRPVTGATYDKERHLLKLRHALIDEPYRVRYEWDDAAKASIREQGSNAVLLPFKMSAPAGTEGLMRTWANAKRYELLVQDTAEKIAQGGKHPQAIFFGDSITEIWAKHKDFFESHGWLPMGISGQTSSHLVQRMRTDILPIRPEYLVILIGTNDIAGNDGEYNAALAFGNIKTICEMALQAGITPLMCSLIPCDGYSWAKHLGNPSQKVIDLNRNIKKYCKSNKIQYVDYFSAMDRGDGGMVDEYTYDRCHPSDKGFEVMESIIVKYIK